MPPGHDGKPGKVAGATPKGAKQRPGITFHVLLMGERKATWLALGADRDELVSHLVASKAGAPDAGTLTARAGLEPLKTGKALAAGFVTVGMVTKPLLTLLNGTLAPGMSPDLKNTLDRLPHNGDTPIFIVSDASAPPTPGPRADVTLNVSRGSLEDLGAVLLTLHRLATNAGLLPP